MEVLFWNKVLEDLSTQQKYDYTVAKAETNSDKNRFPNKLPSMYDSQYPQDLQLQQTFLFWNTR